MNRPTGTRARRVRCPGCGQPALFSPDNPARPFCSLRCRNADLGAWASENYRVATDPPADSDPADGNSGLAH